MDRHVVLADGYPVLGAFLTVVFVVAAAAWLILLFRVLGDILGNHRMSGVGKTVWLICVMFMPFLGVFLYLIATGSKKPQR